MKKTTFDLSNTNLFLCLSLLELFRKKGLKNIVLCPGSRSSPLAIAAGFLAGSGSFRLYRCIDERSASFFALGLSTPTQIATAVVTTSGTAVGELLPAAIEADRSCCPLIFLTADRPLRLKNCGANQTVNQEEFLTSVCRSFIEGPQKGIHEFEQKDISSLVDKSWSKAHQYFSGPVHINLSFEEPLCETKQQQDKIKKYFSVHRFSENFQICPENDLIENNILNDLYTLDPNKPGIIIAGPWRGDINDLVNVKQHLSYWSEKTGWPLIADPLSGLSPDHPGLIRNWELLLPNRLNIQIEDLQVLRLGPLPSSKNLEAWLSGINKRQLLITEGEKRPIDPLCVSIQLDCGFLSWIKLQIQSRTFLDRVEINDSIFQKWFIYDDIVEDFLDKNLLSSGIINEPSLARYLAIRIPNCIPIMLSASSPIRDWISYTGSNSLRRRCYGFRGASGIDGTLSLAMGLSLSLGRTVLITGDLALLYDTNGWLFAKPESPPLLVILIDNGGGGIFQQLNKGNFSDKDIKKLFSMPQTVNYLALVEAYGVPSRQVSSLTDMENALEWGFSIDGPSLIRVCTDSKSDSLLRDDLRNCLEKSFDQSF